MRYRVQDIVDQVPSKSVQEILGDHDQKTNPINKVNAYLAVAQRLSQAEIDVPHVKSEQIAKLRETVMDFSIARVAAVQKKEKEEAMEGKSQAYVTVAQELATAKVDMPNNPNPPATVEAAAQRAKRVDTIVQKLAHHTKKLGSFVNLAFFVMSNASTPHPEMPTTTKPTVVVADHVRQGAIENSVSSWSPAIPLPENSGTITSTTRLSEADQMRIEQRELRKAKTNEQAAKQVEVVGIPGQFGDVLLGSETGAPAKPTFVFIQMGERIINTFIRPKWLTKGEKNPEDYRKKHNVNFEDADGSRTQTVHAGKNSDGEVKWAAELLREFIEEEGTSPEEQLNKLAHADRVVVIQGDVDSAFMPDDFDFADAAQVQEMVKHIGINGEGLIDPVFQEAKIDFAARMNPTQATQYGTALEQAPDNAPASITEELGLDVERIGGLNLFFCGEALPGERIAKDRKANSQSRNIIGLMPVKEVKKQSIIH
ncbi:MAG: hypothetical protein M3Q44_00825 [bacterium]|nr:hypothetical protein [bacterium]